MNYADLRLFDATNGKGIGISLFVSGCLFRCKECFNSDAWNFDYGKPFTKEVEDYFIDNAKNEHIDHISLLGGEVFQQDIEVILNLVRRVKQEVNKPIWIWTGYTFEDLLKDYDKYKILLYVDIIVDGRFEINNKDINLLFRGSSNQRIIDVQKSLKTHRTIEYLK